MSKKPSTATKYDKEDPDFSAQSSSTNQLARKVPTRSAKQKNQLTESSSDDDKNNSEISLNKNSVLDTETSEMGTISEQQLEAILNRVMQASNAGPRQSSTIPKVNIDPLSMSNYSFWSKSIRAALKLMNLWIEPNRNVATLNNNEKITNEKAAQYLLTNIDVNNMSQITSENEQCFITIWNLLKQFHEPQTATTLIDFYSSIHNLLHRPGEDVRMHLLKLETQFEKILEVEDKLPETHKVAIMLASVKNSPEFEQLFYSAKWLKRENLTLKMVREPIIATQDSRRVDHSHQQQQSAHALSKQFKQSHRRRQQNPQKGWACSHCQMDNHKEADCFKKNRRPWQGKTISKQSHSAHQGEIPESENISNIAQAFHGTSSKRSRPFNPSESSNTIKARLGPKLENEESPYQGIVPRSLTSNIAHDTNLLEIHNYDSMSESGKTVLNRFNIQFSNEFTFQTINKPFNKNSTNTLLNFRSSNTSLNFSSQQFSYHSSCIETTNKNLNSKIQTNWIIDSGATIHMCNKKEYLTDYVLKEGHYVTISDGSKIPIEGFGSLIFNILGEDNLQYKFILEDVAFVPKLAVNLISVKELTNLNITVAFANGKCKIIHPKGMITIGTLVDSSYVMKILHNNLREQNNKSSHLCIHEWHKKLSHKNIDQIKRAKNTLKLKIQKCNCTDECIDCIKGKISAPPFPKSSVKPDMPRALITSDLCGQFKSQSLGGAKYFMTLIDAATDYTEVILLKHKSETVTVVQNFMEKCNTQFGHYPKTFRSDRGGEFMSNNLQNYLAGKGIMFECTVPNTPQQNGISERKNRTLVEAVRTILISRNLPHYLWGEALNYANDTFNSIPKGNKENSPKEEYFGKNISFEFIEFGAPVIFHSNEQNRSKLDQKGVQGIFVGIDHNSKGYRVFYNGKILIKRVVKFLSSNPNSSMITEHVINPKITEAINLEPLRCSERLANQKVFISQSVPFEPKTYKQAISCDESSQWKIAMEQELEAIRQHETWTLVDLPKDRTAIGSKWIYKIKTDSSDNFVYKARLVAQGFTQKYGEDYDEVFAPVARPTSFRILLTIAGKENMSVMQFDVKTAFLNGNLDQEIYMNIPKGFQQTNKVLKLRKSLYGLKQAARIWNQAISECLLLLKFKQSKHDNCLFINQAYHETCYLIIHVDDILMASKDKNVIESLANEISKTFQLKYLGEVKQFIGINVERQRTGIFQINQSNYINKIAETFQLESSKGSLYPLDPGYFKLNDDDFLDSNNKYRKVIGMLLYVSTNTRPDISAAIGILAQKVSKPRKLDLTESFRVIKYLLKTQHHSLVLGDQTSQIPLVGYTDANWAENRLDRKSTGGFLCKVFNSTVCWTSKRQDVVAISTTESEYYALAETVREIKWLKALLEDFNIYVRDSIPIYIDSQSCMKMIENEKFSNRTKHIDVRFHFAKEEIMNGNIKLVYEPTASNIADMLTKPLAGVKIKYLRELANINEKQIN